MLFRFLLLLSLIGALTVFTVQNLTLTPLVFLGIPLPALPLSLWVLGAIAAGALSIWAIQGLYQLAAFVEASDAFSDGRSPKRRDRATTADQSPDSRQRSRWESPLRRDRPSTPEPMPFDDRDPAPRWQERRRDPAPVTPRRDRPVASGDEWERPISRDWDGAATVHSPPTPESRDRPREYPPDPAPSISERDVPAPEYPPDPYPQDPYPQDRLRDRRSGEQDSPQRETSRRTERYDEPTASRRDRPTPPQPADQVVDADYRVIVPPYTPLSELIKEGPPPPEPEENADDWFDDPPDDFAPSPKH